ncbi:DUF6894 family protein (plasmid) [Bradyrhizobium barranii]|uniref:DUF6894 family protein n=1 Tax=Bradyrhizobium TaxID=374 RepID=UPI003F23B918
MPFRSSTFGRGRSRRAPALPAKCSLWSLKSWMLRRRPERYSCVAATAARFSIPTENRGLQRQAFVGRQDGRPEIKRRPIGTRRRNDCFDLAGAFTACDRVGHQCASRREAKEHAKFIAHRIGGEKPPFAQPGNYIRVRDEHGVEIFEAPIHVGPGYSMLRQLRRRAAIFYAIPSVCAFCCALLCAPWTPWSSPSISTRWCCSRVTATSGPWWRRCSAAAFASP